MHVTLGCIRVDEGEVEETEQKFRRIGEKFTDVTGAGPFLINFRGLEMGDGSETLFMKVHLGREIMEVLRSIIEDELMGQLTDLRFSPHVTLFGGSTLSPDKKDGLFKTADAVLGPTVSIGSMSLRERMKEKELESIRVVTYHF